MGYDPVADSATISRHTAHGQSHLLTPLTTAPSFQSATSSWSPTHSPRSSPNGSPRTLPREIHLSPSHPHPHRWLAESWSGEAPDEPPPMNKTVAAEMLYAAACLGDLGHIQTLLKAGISSNSMALVKGVYKQFTPAKSGHLSVLAGAASHGQIKAAAMLIAQGASVNPSVHQSSSSPLHCACASNDREMVKFLIRAGADVNLNNCYFNTPLMYAVSFGSSSLVKTLLKRGADVHQVSFLKSAAIHSAIWRNSVDMIEYLASAGSNVNHVMAGGSTPLHLAASAGHMDAVRCLLKLGADPRRRNDDHLRPEQVAEQQDNFAVANLLKRASVLL